MISTSQMIALHMEWNGEPHQSFLVITLELQLEWQGISEPLLHVVVGGSLGMLSPPSPVDMPARKSDAPGNPLSPLNPAPTTRFAPFRLPRMTEGCATSLLFRTFQQIQIISIGSIPFLFSLCFEMAKPNVRLKILIS